MIIFEPLSYSVFLLCLYLSVIPHGLWDLSFLTRDGTQQWKRGVLITDANVLSCFGRVRLCDPMDCSPPGSSVHRILQARILE